MLDDLAPVVRGGWRCAVAIALVVTLACSREPLSLDDLPQHVAVHALLFAGEDTVRVLVTRAVADSYPDASQPVIGAQVQLSWANDSILLSPGSEELGGCTSEGYPEAVGPGCYIGVVPGAVRSGVSYTLHVRPADGSVITGTTFVPARPDVEPHSEPPTIVPLSSLDEPAGNAQPVRLRWKPLEPAASVGIALLLHEEACTALVYHDDHDLRVPLPEIIFSGRTEATVGAFWVRCPLESANDMPGEIRLTSYGEAFVRFLSAGATSNKQHEAIGYGLTGGVGVFAAAASASVPVTVKHR